MSRKIDFDALDNADLVVGTRPWTDEEKRELSEYLRKQREKTLASEKRLSSKMMKPIPTDAASLR